MGLLAGAWPSSWLFGVGISGRELYRIHLASRCSPWWPRAYLLFRYVGSEICIVSLTSELQAGYFWQPTWMFQRHFRLIASSTKLKISHSAGQFSCISIPMDCASLSLTESDIQELSLNCLYASFLINGHTCHSYPQILWFHPLLPTSNTTTYCKPPSSPF